MEAIKIAYIYNPTTLSSLNNTKKPSNNNKIVRKNNLWIEIKTPLTKNPQKKSFMLTLQSELLPYVFCWSLGVYLRHKVA